MERTGILCGIGCLMGLAGIVLAGDPVKGAGMIAGRDDMRKAFSAWQSGKEPAERRNVLDKMVQYADACPTNELSEALSLLGRTTSVAEGKEAFLGVCARRSAAGGSAHARQTATMQVSDWHAAAGNSEEAISILRGYLDEPGLPAPFRDAAARKAASLLAEKLARPDEAAALLGAALAKVDPGTDAMSFAGLACARATLLRGLRDVEGAQTEVRRVLALGEACPANAYVSAAELSAMLDVDAGRPDEAAEVLLSVLRHPSLPPAGFVRKLLDLGVGPAKLEEAVGLLRSRMVAPFTSVSDFQMRLERVQPDLVELLLAIGQADEAVRECRVLAFGASDRAYPQAVELAARCLKARDGNLGRANALLAFHGATDLPAAEGRNVLLSFSPLDDPVRTEGLRALAGTPPVDWNGWLVRSAHLVWYDRPFESLEAARTAFAGCPLATNALQTCANAVARPVLVATRDTALAQRLVDYLLFGAAGPDGRAGTDDDLADPFVEARDRLAYDAGDAAPPASAPVPSAPAGTPVPVPAETSAPARAPAPATPPSPAP